MKSHVYVITASEHGEQKECIVVSKVETAVKVFSELISIYGGRNVVMASRAINDIPENIKHRLTKRALDEKPAGVSFIQKLLAALPHASKANR